MFLIKARVSGSLPMKLYSHKRRKYRVCLYLSKTHLVVVHFDLTEYKEHVDQLDEAFELQSRALQALDG